MAAKGEVIKPVAGISVGNPERSQMGSFSGSTGALVGVSGSAGIVSIRLQMGSFGNFLFLTDGGLPCTPEQVGIGWNAFLTD